MNILRYLRRNAVDLLVIIYIVGLSICMPVANTENWFAELVREKEFLDLFGNNEILLPPVYPALVWLLSKLNDSLLVLRLWGVVQGYLLYMLTVYAISKSIRIVSSNRGGSLNRSLSRLAGLVAFVTVYFYSDYMLLYDFTITVITLQAAIICLFLNRIDICRDDNTKKQGRRLRWMIYGATIFLITVKHSNGLVYLFAVFVLDIILTINQYMQMRVILTERMATGKFIRHVASLLTVLFLLFYIARFDPIKEFVIASLEAKGGAVAISNRFSEYLSRVLVSVNQNALTLTCAFNCLLVTRIGARERNRVMPRGLGHGLQVLLVIWIVYLLHRDYPNGNIGALSELWLSAKIIIIMLYVIAKLTIIRLDPSGTSELSHIISNEQELVSCWVVWVILGLGAMIGNLTSGGIGYNGLYFVICLILIDFILAENVSSQRREA